LQAYEDILLNRGKHTFQSGIALEHSYDNVTGELDPSGNFTFSSLTAFLTNQPDVFGASIATSNPVRQIRQTIIGTYLQDQWRLLPILSINLGLRYEPSTLPREINNHAAFLRNFTDAQAVVGDTWLQRNPTLHNFAPHVGFAWDPFSSGKTIVS